MIQKGMYMFVSDNSGVKKVKCIKIFGTSNPRSAKIGSLVLISVSNKDVLRGFTNSNIRLGLVINVNIFFKRKNGESIKFDQNTCLIINQNKIFSYTRVYNPIVIEAKKHQITNLGLFAEAVV